MNNVEDLWMKIEKQQAQSENNFSKDNTIETTLLIVGEPSSGKSSLIQAFLKPSVTKEPKPTIALEYNYAKKKAPSTTNANQNITNLCHIWELGGEVNESKLLEIPLNKTTVSTSSIIIVCDLSKPANILMSLQKWIKVTRELIKKQVTDFRAANNNIKFHSKIYSQSNTNSSYREHTKDSNRARPCEIPIYIVLNKYDVFKTTQANDKRALYQAARMFAHYHGAHVITASVVEPTLKDAFRSHMNYITFPPLPPPPIPTVLPQTTATSTTTDSSADNTDTSAAKLKEKEKDTASLAASVTAAASTTKAKSYYDINIEKPVQITAGRDDFETILIMSLGKKSSLTYYLYTCCYIYVCYVICK